MKFPTSWISHRLRTPVLDHANDLIKMFAVFGVINCVPAATPVHNIFYYPAVAHISTDSVNLVFGPKSGFKNKCRTRDGFGLQNEAPLQLCGNALDTNTEKFFLISKLSAYFYVAINCSMLLYCVFRVNLKFCPLLDIVR